MTSESSGPHSGNLSTGRELPASFRLGQVIKELSSITGPIAFKLANEAGDKVDDNGFTSFNNHTVPLWTDVRIGPIDAIKISTLLISSGTDGLITDLTLKIYSDGSPFVFESDLTTRYAENLYDLIILPEYPPFLVVSNELDWKEGVMENLGYAHAAREYLAAIREGSLPPAYILTEEDCQSLIDAIQEHGPELIEHIEAV